MIGVIAALAGYSSDATSYLIAELRIGWMTGFLFPRVAVVICSLLLSLSVVSTINLSSILKWVLGTVVFGLGVGGYLLVNLPYVNDWMRIGATLDQNEPLNPVELYLQESYPNFDGLVMFSLPGCPYCEEAIGNLEVLHRRVPDRDLLVLVFVKDSTSLANYKREFSTSALAFEFLPEPKVSVALNRGQFPGFFYIKDGRMIHRWFSGQFGYPAYDWVENGLE